MSRLLSLAAAVSFAARGALGDCVSYGMDFQDGGEYFQNVSSSDPFTFAQQFSGCEQDNSFNLLVDPNGNQTECSQTPLVPDDTTQTSTCPNLKNQLWSGAWSIIVLSNNGDNGLPIAFQRDFVLDVGVPETITYTPTVTSTVVIVPTINTTSTAIGTTTTTLAPVTTTVPRVTIQKTKTITPQPVTTTTSINLATITIPKFSVSVTKIVKTATASCHLPARQPYPDPFLHIWPAIPQAQSIAISAASAAGVAVPTATTLTGSAKFRQVRDPLASLEQNREKWLQERAARLADAPRFKRAPDVSVVTSTEQATSNWITSTAYSTTAPVTSTVVATSTITNTVTPAPITIVSGSTVLPPATVTQPTQTKTRTIYGIAKVTSTRVQTYSITVTTTVSPAASKTACRRQGGFYY